MKIQIKNRYNGSVIVEGESENLKCFLESNKGMDLVGADLVGANLRNADLVGANLRNADLRNADLGSADLRNADLGSADLRNADLGGGFKYSLNGVKYVQKSTPIQIFLTHYIVIIFTDTIRIGCKHYTKTEWINFTDEQINEMDKGKSLVWWLKYKEIILKLAEVAI